MCTIPTGALLVGGFLENVYGAHSYDKPTSQCIRYSKQDNTWHILPKLPIEYEFCVEASVCISGTSVYVMGRNNVEYKMFCFDLVDKTWHSCPGMQVALNYPTVGCVNKSIYVMFSTYTANNNLQQGSNTSLKCYDTTSSTWSFKASLPQAIHTVGAKAVTIDQYLYVIGCGEPMCLRYDTQDNSWTTLTPPFYNHNCGVAVVVKGTIFLCGGWSEHDDDSDVIESYDPQTDSWTVLPERLPRCLQKHYVIAL